MSWLHHADKVLEDAFSPRAAATSRLAASWRRSAVTYGLDPRNSRAPERVDQSNVGYRRDAMGAFLALATPQLDQLFRMVGNTGCCVLLTDAEGVVLEQRCSDSDRAVFQSWGLWEGAVWSEQTEGTNGIGTCLAEKRQVVIHRDEHFHSRNTGMSCMDAPIYDADGEVVAALDVSSCRADQTEGYTRLIAGAVAQTARQIETAHFRAAFAGARFVDVGADRPEETLLLAVDRDDLVIGATRAARRKLGLTADSFANPLPAADLLGMRPDAAGLDHAERAALRRALARAGGNASAAARALGIGRATLYRRMKRLGLD
ncbi:sigma-54-dependent Fis family transcriptional regulator [Thalassobius vesicularis]|uniref:Sigma-54-dependent Fis family transcriptional regulator n=1 Tax=Thalassobius vesicularis TaxID=1294297 RepID=A0A4S3MDF1_9RHOB|nr:GAF domain-containing protein [Thalassobius vesicularis]THD76507.1 sigma-54-dependent Fis family transcriptional regulator [Thalassobius vesicularis]